MGASTHFFGQRALDSECSAHTAAEFNILGHPELFLVLQVVFLDGLKADVHVGGELLQCGVTQDKARTSHAVDFMRQQPQSFLVLLTSLAWERGGRKMSDEMWEEVKRGREGGCASNATYVPPVNSVTVSNES